MPQSLNGKPILVNSSGLFLAGSTLNLSVEPRLDFRAADAPVPAIAFQPYGYGFIIEIRGFTPGLAMATMVTGTLGGKSIVILCSANRLAELPDGAFYQIQCQLSEA